MGKREKNEVSCIKEDLSVLDEVGLDLYFMGCLEIHLKLYLICWLAIWLFSKSNFISLYK